jgi:hypothetical protein
MAKARFEVPLSKLTCPVTKKLFDNPVTLQGSGVVVEESVAKECMAQSHPTCPVSGKVISGYDANDLIKELASSYKATQHHEQAASQAQQAFFAQPRYSAAPPPDSSPVHDAGSRRGPGLGG